MSKPAVVYILVAVPILIFLSSTQRSAPRQQRGRRLHHHMTFDPLMDELERRAQEKGMVDVKAFWEKMRVNNGMLTYYFGEEGSLNTQERLKYLFPLLDQAPMDGFISFAELDLWNRKQALDRLMYSTERRMRTDDENNDGEVTFSEFLSHATEEEKDWDKEHGALGWKDLFEIADANGNGSLNEIEFNEFLHPEDSVNPKVQMWFRRKTLSEMDQDEDGKLSFEEFRDKTRSISSYAHDFETVMDDNRNDKIAERKFAELDVNRDKFLTAEELRPIIHHIYPGEFSHATYYTKYLMHKVDANKDGKLTLEEMLGRYYEFYSAVFEEENDIYDDDEYDYIGHNEF